MLTDRPISFNASLQSLTAQSTLEAELVEAALTTKEAVSYSNMMVELSFKNGFRNVR